MQIELWTMDDCPECDAVKRDLDRAQARYTEYRVEELIDHPDRSEALAEFCARSMQLPLLRVRRYTPSGWVAEWTDLAALRAHVGVTEGEK